MNMPATHAAGESTPQKPSRTLDIGKRRSCAVVFPYSLWRCLGASLYRPCLRRCWNGCSRPRHARAATAAGAALATVAAAPGRSRWFWCHLRSSMRKPHLQAAAWLSRCWAPRRSRRRRRRRAARRAARCAGGRCSCDPPVCQAAKTLSAAILPMLLYISLCIQRQQPQRFDCTGSGAAACSRALHAIPTHRLLYTPCPSYCSYGPILRSNPICFLSISLLPCIAFMCHLPLLRCNRRCTSGGRWGR